MAKAIEVERFARRLRFGVSLFAVLLAIFTVLSIVRPATPDTGGAFLNQDGLPLKSAIATAIFSVMLTLAALVELCRMLRMVEADASFSLSASRHLKRFAALLIGGSASAILLPAALRAGIAVTGHHSMTLSIDGNDALLLLVSIVFFLIARLLEIAAHYEDDSRSIV